MVGYASAAEATWATAEDVCAPEMLWANAEEAVAAACAASVSFALVMSAARVRLVAVWAAVNCGVVRVLAAALVRNSDSLRPVAAAPAVICVEVRTAPPRIIKVVYPRVAGLSVFGII